MAFDIVTYNRRMFKNNIDWLGKSLQNFVDFIFGEDTDNSAVPCSVNDCQAFHCITVLNLHNQSDGEYLQTCYAVCDFYGDYRSCEIQYSHVQNDRYFRDDAHTATWLENASRAFANASSQYPFHTSDEFLNTNNTIYFPAWTGNNWIRCFTKPDNVANYMTNQSGSVFGVNFGLSADDPDNVGYINTADFDVNTYHSEIGLPAFILNRPSYYIGSPDTAQYIYNNQPTYNQYHTYNNITINGGSANGGGDIFVGGGLGGVAVGVAGLVNFGDVKFAIDSLIDDINLNVGDDYDLPAYFPSYDELKYEDQGSFYITPIKQIPALPDAPDVADVTIDVSDFVTVLGGSVNQLLDCFDSIGLSLMLTFAFLACLVIRNLRGS